MQPIRDLCNVFIAQDTRARLMILEPESTDAAMWPFDNVEWLHRFHELIRRDDVDVWFHSKHLGSEILVLPNENDDDESIPKWRRTLRHNMWIINTARIEAAQVNDTYNPGESHKGRLYGLFVWDDTLAGDRSEIPEVFIRAVNEFDGYRGEVEVIGPEHGPPVEERTFSAGSNL
jgi:hypothetical protein